MPSADCAKSDMERRVVLGGPGLIDVRSWPTPQPGPAELLIRPDAVGICRTDVELLSGEMPYLRSGFAAYPIVPGHEWTGLVAAVGSDVAGFSVGDRVVGECSVGCGACPTCAAGRYHLCPERTETGIAGRAGALATAIVLPSRSAHPVPSTVDPADAALIEPTAVAYRALDRLCANRLDRLAVVGGGTIGLLCALTARALGCSELVILDVDARRREFAASLGFEVTARPGARMPCVVEASGTAAGVASALDLCADGGELVLLGLTGLVGVPLDVDGVVVRDLTLRGSLGSAGVWPAVIDLVASGRLRPSLLVSHELPLDAADAAFALAARGTARKVLVRPGAGAP